MEKQLRSLAISDEKVKIKFVELEAIAASKDSKTDDDKAKGHKWGCESTNIPHKDLTDSMKKLRKHGFEILGLDIDSKDLSRWNCSMIKISGDYLLKKARVILQLSVRSKLTGKLSYIETGQVTMYPDAEDAVKYHDADKMTVVIEDCIEEAFSYLNGKYGEDEMSDLPLFAKREAVEA